MFTQNSGWVSFWQVYCSSGGSATTWPFLFWQEDNMLNQPAIIYQDFRIPIALVMVFLNSHKMGCVNKHLMICLYIYIISTNLIFSGSNWSVWLPLFRCYLTQTTMKKYVQVFCLEFCCRNVFSSGRDEGLAWTWKTSSTWRCSGHDFLSLFVSWGC